MSYWGKVAARGWADTKPWLGLSRPSGNARRALATVGFTAGVGAALILLERVPRASWYLAIVFAFLAFLSAVAIWNFVRAPECLHREAEAMIASLTSGAERRTTTQQDVDALQGAYAVGRELLRMKDQLDAESMKARVDEWFSGTATMVQRVGSRNEAFTFATAADFASVPGGDKAPSGLLLTRLAKLKHIIDRMVEQQAGGPKVPGARRSAAADD